MVWIICFRIEESSLARRTYPLQKERWKMKKGQDSGWNNMLEKCLSACIQGTDGGLNLERCKGAYPSESREKGEIMGEAIEKPRE